MKQGIVYVLYGDQNDRRSRVHKILRDVRSAAGHRDRLRRTVAYVFGEDNHRFAREYGFETRLLDRRPLVPAASAHGYANALGHKVLGWEAALEEFEDVLALDWDILPLGPINQTRLFERLGRKSFLQANLLQYRRRKATYRVRMEGSVRRPSTRQIPSGAFVYLRGQDGRHAVSRCLGLMKADPTLTEEQAIGRFLDEMYGGWKGIEHWRFHHEPFCCKLPRQREAASDGGLVPLKKEYLFTY